MIKDNGLSELKKIVKNIEKRTKILFLLDEIRAIGVNPFKLKEELRNNKKEEEIKVILDHMKDFKISIKDFNDYINKDETNIKANPSSKERLKELRKDIKKEIIINTVSGLNMKLSEFFIKNNEKDNIDLALLLLINNKIKKLDLSYSEVELYYNKNKTKIANREKENFKVIIENKKGLKNGL